MSLSVIIPCYNECGYIPEVIDRVKRGGDFVKQIIVVDDGSSDDTRGALEAYRDDPMIVVHFLERNSGKGAAIRAGLGLVDQDIVIIQDADLEYDPAQMARVIAPIVDGQADVVYGSRFAGSIKGMRLQNRIANVLLTWTANFLYRAHITDEATCYKAFKSEIIKTIPLTCRRFEFCPEVTAKLRKRDIRIAEVPIDYAARTAAQGKKIKWLDGLLALWTLIKYRFVD